MSFPWSYSRFPISFEREIFSGKQLKFQEKPKKIFLSTNIRNQIHQNERKLKRLTKWCHKNTRIQLKWEKIDKKEKDEQKVS